MIFEQTEDFGRTDASEYVFEVIAQPMPDGLRVQLLRSLGRPALKQGRCTHQRCPRLAQICQLFGLLWHGHDVTI
jgi:hypothetical protein